MGQTYALCVGINAYPNAPLQGCVNDARDWEELLREKGYHTILLLDSIATKRTILETLRFLVEKARFGDRIVFTNSGHGSWIPDMSGDEPDGKDEVICAYDYESGGYIVDDELEDIFTKKRFGVRITSFGDQCFSGSSNRFIGPQGVERFVHPSTFLTRPEQVRRIALVNRLPARTLPRTSKSVLFSGCSDEEFSYDGYFPEVDRFNGAFTEAAIRTNLENQK